MEKLIVFDFDKTLTNYDTIFPFFLFCCRRQPSRYFVIPVFILVKILCKFHLIEVKKEKELGLLFFCPNNINTFKDYCFKFAATVKLNTIYLKEFVPLQAENNKLVVASASFQYYLEYLFPGVAVIGTTLKLDKQQQKIIGVDVHPFRENKAKLLELFGISKIYRFYTDSKNDIPTSLISEKTIWVRKGKVIG